jgi:hypothetical protein
MKNFNQNVLVDSYLNFLNESTNTLFNPEQSKNVNPVLSFKHCIDYCDTGVMGSEAFYCINKCKAKFINNKIDELNLSKLKCDSDFCKNIIDKNINILYKKLNSLINYKR